MRDPKGFIPDTAGFIPHKVDFRPDKKSTAEIKVSVRTMTQALEDKAFLEFLGKFPDAESLEMKSSDEDLVMERYGQFELYLEVSERITETLKKKISSDIGIALESKDLEDLNKYIEEQSAGEDGAEFLRQWQKQLDQYEQLPKNIALVEGAIEQMGDMGELREKLYHKKLKAEQLKLEKRDKDFQAEQLKGAEAVHRLVEEGLGETGEVEKLMKKESEDEAKYLDLALEEFKHLQKDLDQLAKAVPEAAFYIVGIGFEKAKAEIEWIKKEKSNPGIFYEGLKTGTLVQDIAQALDKAQAQLNRFVEEFKSKDLDEKTVGKTNKILKDLQKRLSSFPEKDIQALVNHSNDSVEAINTVHTAKRALQYLREEPWNQKALEALKNTDQVLAKRLQKFAGLANRIETVATSHDLRSAPENLRSVLEYSNKNSFVRFFKKSPGKKASNEARELGESIKGLEQENRGIEKNIVEIRDAKRARDLLELDYKYAQAQVFDQLPEIKAVFKKAKDKLHERFEKMAQTGSKLDLAFQNLASVENMEAMDTDDYERYFDGSDPALPDRESRLEYLRDIVLAKVSEEIKKVMEKKLGKEPGLTKLHEALKDFEGKLGEAAKGDSFAKVKYSVLLKLASDPNFSMAKRLLVKRLIAQGVENGSIRPVLNFA